MPNILIEFIMRSHSALSILCLCLLLLLQTGCGNKTSQTPAPKQADAGLDDDGYPAPENWVHASEQQSKRAARSFAQLKKRSIPAYDGPLFVADDDAANLQTPQDVARRALVLWAVELRAEGTPQHEAKSLIEEMNLWDFVSEKEKAFLDNPSPEESESARLVWRLESIWVLLWALGHVDDLNWPSEMCDVPQLVQILRPLEADPDFITNAKLRPRKEILDQQDLIMRIHWAIRDAYLNHEAKVPEDLDWSGSSQLLPIQQCAAVGVVEQRHYVLNWIVRYLDPKGWDDVDTPT